MKQVVVNILCDRKNVHPDTQEPASEVPLLNSRGKPVKVDMCEPCQKGITLMEAVELADAVGEAIDLPKQTRNRTAKPSPGPCEEPGCGAEFPTHQGLAMHMNRTHGKKLEKK